MIQNVLFELVIAIGQLALALVPFIFVGVIFCMIARTIYMNNKLMDRIRKEFPEARNNSTQMEAIIRGIQRSGRL